MEGALKYTLTQSGRNRPAPPGSLVAWGKPTSITFRSSEVLRFGGGEVDGGVAFRPQILGP